MIHQASNLSDALQIAQTLRDSGEADWFRGQTRNWPMLSSFGRRDEPGRESAIQRLADFTGWLSTVSELQPIADDVDATLAVAQHYGIPTTFIDFSIDPRVAAFFAAHDPPVTCAQTDEGCIICLSTQELTEFWEAISATRPELPEPRRVVVDIPELWRIQAQRGAFLFYPYDEGFERHMFGFDRILFPLNAQADELVQLIPREDIYPPQKSDLEILLDQYFMLERMREGEKALHSAFGSSLFSIRHDPPADGIERECFGPAGLPAHESWNPSRIEAWIKPSSERWVALSDAPQLSITCPSTVFSSDVMGSLTKQFEITMAQHSHIRMSPVRWKVLGFSIQEGDAIEKTLSLLWDGLRRWPYSDFDIAVGMATAVRFEMLVCQSPQARYSGNDAEAIAIQCFGDAVEVEIAMQDSSYSRGYAGGEELFGAVRQDFGDYLANDWRPRITKIRPILQVAVDPRRVFDFKVIARVFCHQIVPSQVVLRSEDTGKARIYNPARMVRLGLP